MQLPKFFPIIDTAFLATQDIDPVEFAHVLAQAGVGIAQYRHKGHFTRERFEQAAAIGRILREAGIPYIVNDRADIALAVGADGVHVGQEDLPPADVRRVIGPNKILGFSTHNAEQLAAGDNEPVDYLAIGPVFATASKQKPDPVVGLEGLGGARSQTAKPLAAIGGVTLHKAAAVLKAGADSLAVISAMDESNLHRWLQL